ncbi:MAG: hypothetical protein HY899_12035 [Deltaproteobacteria bacterium]|nr:hypothetical protein [Deltaproteobacteria bacterium]
MNIRPPRLDRRRALLLAAVLAGCTPVSNSYDVHSADLSCEEANRMVYAAVIDMNMKVTAFTQAQPGRPGFLRATGSDRSGTVSITCDPGGVVIDPRQTSMGDRIFERGILLSVTGRAGLSVAHGNVTGRIRPVSAEEGATSGEDGHGVSPSGGVGLEIEPQHGFSTVLDFDADVAAAGVLPIKVTIRNGTNRSYQFSPADLVVRVRGSRASAEPLTPADAAARLVARAGSESAQTQIGNVASARKVIVDRALKGGKLTPGASASGYVYYPVGDYDRAKLTMTDVSTGEAEGFLVEF